MSYYTEEVLTRNFSNINDGLTAASKLLYNHSNRISELEDLVTDLSEQIYDVSKTLVKVAKRSSSKNSKLLILTVAAGGIYLGYRYAQEEIAKGRPSELSDKAAANVKKAADTVSDTIKKNGDGQK